MGWHSKNIEEIYAELHTGTNGLADANAKERLAKYGPNELEEKEKKSKLAIFLSQFNSFIVWILIIAAIISFAMGHLDSSHEENSNLDGLVIIVILVINSIVGFVQEYKAEESIEALRKLAALKAKVIRGGREIHVPSQEIVPGDIIVLETGDKVPADARIIECQMLEADESSLTGESTTVTKQVKPVAENSSLADRVCMVYSSTTISKGRASAVVVATGMETEIGKIANMVQQAGSGSTPLQEKLAQLARFLGLATLIVCAIVFMVMILRVQEIDTEIILSSLMVAVALAVAAIPEGLPAVVTTCLALGVRRMVKKNALVRKLPSVETLGSCNIICTDKTGTLTYNQMTVRELHTQGRDYTVTGQGYIPEGQFTSSGGKAKAGDYSLLLRIGALCNDAKLGADEIFGDPTEAALLVVAKKAGLDYSQLNSIEPRVDEIPFDSARKLMTTVHKSGSKKMGYVKGAPDVIIEKCSHMLVGGKARKITAKDRKNVLAKNSEMASRALRVLGFAYKQIKGKPSEKNLVFVGLMGMIDPPRSEVKDAIQKCKTAGIRVVMITGDHKETAVAISRELGMQEGRVLTGQEMDKIENLRTVVDEVTVYARVSPQHKMKIIDALKQRDYVVAMTGDGVNDAPALKKADIGIAMGKAGTDVAKEASDMILTDDNFTSIVNAVEEGRGIYDNIRKFAKYLLSSNFGEILVIFIAILIGYTDPQTARTILPLVPIQLLWINLLTDGLPALALGVEPTDPDVMRQQPRKNSDKIISRTDAMGMVFLGIVMALGTLFVFHYALAGGNAVYAVTMAFTMLVIFQLYNVLNCKNENKSIFRTGVMNNKWLLLAILSSLMLQLAVLYTPLSGFMKTMPLNLSDWGIVLAVGSTVIIFEEIRKIVTHNGRT